MVLSPRWGLRLRVLAVVAISLAAHGAPFVASPRGGGLRGGPRPRLARSEARRFGALAARAGATVARAAQIGEARARLVASARAELREGRLHLGEFLLRANALDAEERGAPFDLEEARRRYGARVDALRAALAGEAPRFAVPEVLGDLRYFGRPGGLMAEALLDGGGSCEQISHLVAAAAHDCGLGDRVALRYYGGVMEGGAVHLAPVEVAGAEEVDLLAGRPALRTGTRFAATDLVEAYARVHGLAPPLPAAPARPAPGVVGPASLDAEPGRPSLTAGYPPNADRFPGSVPLYAARAVADPTLEDGPAEAAALEQQSRAHDCAFFVRIAALDPPAITIDPGPSRGTFRVELRKIPAPSALERKAALLRGAEDIAAADGDPADRLMADACLTALSRDVAADFALAGETKLADLAARKGNEGAARGAAAVAAVAWDGPYGAELERRLSERFAGQTWLLLFLRGGDRIVLHLARAAAEAAPSTSGSDWGLTEVLAALVVAPATRARAYPILGGLPRRAQGEVMHEIFHAHNHLRPWASSYAIEGDGGTASGRAFLGAYRVFRALAARFWEGQRPVAETLAALSREARAVGLDREWEALFLDYYGRNLIGVSRNRVGAPEAMRLLARAVEENGHPALDALRRAIDGEMSGRSGARPVL